MDTSGASDKHDNENPRSCSLYQNQPSLSSLIIWNVSKALEKNPHIDLRRAMRTAHDRMEHQSHDVNDLVSQYPEERHVACAVLAWQQLGHKDTDSLYEFIESHQNKLSRNTSENSTRKENIYSFNSSDDSKRLKGFIDHKPSVYRSGVDSTSFDTTSLIGPVVKLPVETKLVMRVENTAPCAHHGAKKSPKNDIKNKLDAACCLDSSCVEKLKEMEKFTAELRSRATQLARREAERAELLERAEAAWRDLELGYQRRLLLAEEKEEDITKQIKKTIEDRNAYKHVCTVLAQELGKRGNVVENERARLTQVEKEVCDLACTRHRLCEESAKGDTAVVDQQCKIVQLERDLQFKEEQVRRKLLTVESVMDSLRGLTLETERAMRQELGVIKEQISQVSSQLLEEDAENNRIKSELDQIRQQKSELFEDLEGCKEMCDNRMQGIADDLNKKRQMLKELKDKVIECQCKLPLDAAVEVKRTPSLAALCRCTPEEHILHRCSCTSVRSTLLSNLLVDLFGGLQSELGDTGSLMPCQLLKCLEDKHNWDRASIVKSNLRSFFSQLLVGELDTAIATSIEKYHATWVGASCADKAKMTPDPGEEENEGWQERVLERRAQKLAGQLAEQLYQERADQLVQRARDIVTSGPPPCECRQQSNKAAAYPCLVKPFTIGGSGKRNDANYPTYMKRTLQDVTLLRTQIEDLKKESIKKEDLRIMEANITKIVQQASGPDSTTIVKKNASVEDDTVKQKSMQRSASTENFPEITENNIKKKKINSGFIRKSNKKTGNVNGRLPDSKLTEKTIKKMEQSYAVNLCLYDGNKKPSGRLQKVTCTDDVNIWKEKLSQDVLSMKHSRPIEKMLSKDNQSVRNKKKTPNIPCKCFHRVPSNTSIDKLLKTLLKWKGGVLNQSLFNMTPSKLNKGNSYIKEIHYDSEFSKNKMSLKMSDFEESQSVNHSVKATEIDPLPLLTTSEYIGAINLDKSNENICKCNVMRDKEKESKYGTNISNANLLFKCLDRSKCSCKKSNEVKKKENAVQAQESIKSMNENIKALIDIKQLHDENCILDGKRVNTERCKSGTSINHKNNQTSENNFFPKDRDALVKFLGVTLTDIKGYKASIGKGNNKKQCTKNYSNNEQSGFFSKVASSMKTVKDKQFSDINNIDLVPKYQSKTNLCQFVELCTNLDETNNECNEYNNGYNNSQCLGEVVCDRKSCVCCNYDDEKKNLEVNTFCLLEKHLKHKLAEFRKSSGKSTCILPDEEEKLFITILDKVKQVVSNCTYNMTCECSVADNNSSSWTRFNNLLEEYLKIKIKRAQCSCVLNKDSVDTVLPGVLEQVSNLIENDFERLKNLCKNKNSNNLECRNKISDGNKIQNITKNIENQNFFPGASCIISENVSTQRSNNLGVEDKSCDVIEMKDAKDVQTSHNDLSLQSHSAEVIISSHCCDLHKGLMFNNNCACKTNKESKSQIICGEHRSIQTSLNTLRSSNNDTIISKRSLQIPYIGYTLTSCDNKLGSCICSKSLSQSYLNSIDTIWKMLEINKKLLPNLSYIMHSLPKKARSEDNVTDYIEVAEASLVPVISESQSVKNVNTSGGEEIILKESNEMFNHNDINDNMTSTLDNLISVKTECYNDDDALYWYDCSSSHNKNNVMMQKKSLYDSIYSPIGKLPKPEKSDTSMKNNITMCISKSKNCDCVMVPVCHVKMLVGNIESKLENSQCTCDSLSVKVCPYHSKTL